ncbi:MAG: hypothetical protein QNJ14_17145 [Woeseiaceae bacterium]|nr:hypothetical protein [Woeseiaceae bacterium]
MMALVLVCLVAACGGDGGSSNQPAPPPNQAPTITGTPSESVRNGSQYEFIPQAADADGDGLTFTIQGQPGWTEFDSGSGAMAGTPFADDIGVYEDIIIAVSDGSTSSALPAFSIEVTSNSVVFDIATAGAVTVSALNVVSATQLAADKTSYVLSIEVENLSGVDLSDVAASLDRVPEDMTLFNRVDKTIEILELLSGASVSPSDTFEVVVNSGGLEQLSKLVIEFDDQSLDGIDSDLNGYRDDVETLVVAELPAISMIESTMINDLAASMGSVLTQEITLQMMRAREDEMRVIAHCLDGGSVDVGQIITLLSFLVFDTDARQQALSQAQQTLALGGLSLVVPQEDLSEICNNRYGI